MIAYTHNLTKVQDMEFIPMKIGNSFRGQWLQVDPLRDKYAGWSGYNYVEDNPINLVDSTGKEPGGNPDPSTFFTQYFLNEYNSLWITGSHIVYNFTYNTLPVALDAVSYGTVRWAPELSALAGGLSLELTVEKNILEGKGLITNENLEGLGTFSLGFLNSPTIRTAGTVLQLGFDAVNTKSNDNRTTDYQPAQNFWVPNQNDILRYNYTNQDNTYVNYNGN